MAIGPATVSKLALNHASSTMKCDASEKGDLFGKVITYKVEKYARKTHHRGMFRK